MQDVLQVLGYQGSTNFIASSSASAVSAVDYAHIFRKAKDACGLRGVYVLRSDPKSGRAMTPVVYVCNANDEASANEVHRRVWNQNIAPFLLVQTPGFVRLYLGFTYRSTGQDAERGVLEATVAYNQVADRLSALKADAIDNGLIWKQWGELVTPETRVDWQLLDNLRALDDFLRQDKLNRDTSHALIGKFVYLRYLRDRGILSDRKLAKLSIGPESVFSRNATLPAFWALDDHLNKWLNGAVFPLTARKADIRAEHLKKVAAVFFGDEPAGQLHLPFNAYDFSFIPTETLSSIYEQFLHAPGEQEQEPPGRQAAAYYTPVPLVNFLLDELDEKHPLKRGMKVLDPACGSGAFLVQCYRRLIERTTPRQGTDRLQPSELRRLLVDHIFGVERDGDACQVAELSLILTLLDCVEPPDLENTRFQLPKLRNSNIFESDFFDSGSAFAATGKELRFDWVVGNPPWKELKSGRLSVDDRCAWKWMRFNAREFPVGGYQLAEAFAWKATTHLGRKGTVGLLMPAMTLFKDESERFRSGLFTRASVWCIANFANLAYVLFGGRAEKAAAAFFYMGEPSSAGNRILTYAPFVVNQDANRPLPRHKKTTWNIVVNSSELREVSQRQAANGSMLPWKAAMWGSQRDLRLLERLHKAHVALGDFCDTHRLHVHEGFALRAKQSSEDVEFLPQVVGKNRVDMTKLRRCGHIFSFPATVLSHIDKEHAYLRLRGGRAGLAVCRPPHIILDAARRFAIFSSEFLVVPPRQIGIAGPQEEERLLRALSLYLASDFALYHQFFSSPEWGIDTTIATLQALRDLPVPLGHLSSQQLKEWADLQASLARPNSMTEDGEFRRRSEEQDSLAKIGMHKVNAWVCDLLGLSSSEQILVRDFVNIKMQLVKGKVTKDTIRSPSEKEIRGYLLALENELNDFVGTDSNLRHKVSAVLGNESSIVCIDLKSGGHQEHAPVIQRANDMTSNELRSLRPNLLRKHSQWLYFERGLRIYEGSRTYLYKPMEFIHWTETQALLDADEIIAEIVVTDES
ncbi:MAG: N-6 DNA methylase [Candidatus Brocadiia bacterium]